MLAACHALPARVAALIRINTQVTRKAQYAPRLAMHAQPSVLQVLTAWFRPRRPKPADPGLAARVHHPASCTDEDGSWNLLEPDLDPAARRPGTAVALSYTPASGAAGAPPRLPHVLQAAGQVCTGWFVGGA